MITDVNVQSLQSLLLLLQPLLSLLPQLPAAAVTVFVAVSLL
jgi:hypothetical protein